jgi:putative tricarboxylic transport membrane protein
MSGSLTGNDPLKGWLMGFLGLFTAQIGLDGIHAHERFTFGWSELTGGMR